MCVRASLPSTVCGCCCCAVWVWLVAESLCLQPVCLSGCVQHLLVCELPRHGPLFAPVVRAFWGGCKTGRYLSKRARKTAKQRVGSRTRARRAHHKSTTRNSLTNAQNKCWPVKNNTAKLKRQKKEID